MMNVLPEFDLVVEASRWSPRVGNDLFLGTLGVLLVSHSILEFKHKKLLSIMVEG